LTLAFKVKGFFRLQGHFDACKDGRAKRAGMDIAPGHWGA